MDFIIAFRIDLFIKVYQRILSADYTVLSILPSANPLNEWDGFSVIGGNGPAIKQVAEGNLPEGRSDRRERSFIACWALLNGA